MVLGASGNFGKRICESLVTISDIKLVISGRNREKILRFYQTLKNQHQNANIEHLVLDITSGQFQNIIKAIQPYLVIHTAGPFQGQNHRIPETCIGIGSHYIDLADDRRFVCDIKKLYNTAVTNNVLVVSGASSVPGLSSAVVDEYSAEFSKLDEIDFGIIPGNQADLGAATLRGVLSGTGHAFKSWIDGGWKDTYGWSDVRQLHVGIPLGKRWLANVDIPDLELFPERYNGVNTVRFQAGLELGLLHNTMALMALLTKAGLVNNWAKYTHPILRLSHLFDGFGTDLGGMFVSLKGTDQQGGKLTINWKLIAKDGVGPYIPAIAAIIIADKLLKGRITARGAFPCLGFFSLDEFSHVAGRWGVYHQMERQIE